MDSGKRRKNRSVFQNLDQGNQEDVERDFLWGSFP